MTSSPLEPIGRIAAVNHFDPSRHAPLRTYAQYKDSRSHSG